MLAAIPYHTFPEFSFGPLIVRTFGVFVALGMLTGVWLAGRRLEASGLDRGRFESIAFWMLLAGIVGARLTWVLTHLEMMTSPLDVVALWEGGLQFSGGFAAAVIVGVPAIRARWQGPDRWRVLDAGAFGLTAGLAIGRIGCYAVGEHLGGTTDFPLAVHYLGGRTVEGNIPIGATIHNTALYEFLHLAVLASVFAWLYRRHEKRILSAPGPVLGGFLVWYGIARFLTDTVRVYDDRVLGLTGAQWMSPVLVAVGVVILLARRRRGAAEAGTARTEGGIPEEGATPADRTSPRGDRKQR